jgi:16S rRNA processing protein RimM
LASSNSSAPQDPILCARFGATHGVRGAIKVYSDTNPPEAMLTYSPWWIEGPDGWGIFEYTNPKVAGKYLLVTPVDCTDCDMAQRYVNKKIAIDRSAFPEVEEGTYYWADIIGCAVHNHDQAHLGTVVDIFDQAGTDIFVVEQPNKKRLLIPHTKAIVHNIDTANKRLDVRWDMI